MNNVEINVLIVSVLRDWGKWPWTEDTDFSELQQEVRQGSWDIDGLKVIVNVTVLPAHVMYRAINYREKPPSFPHVDNTVHPNPRVVQEMIRILRRYAKTHNVICWEHGHQCFPAIAEQLPKLFPVRILTFADDCPGSSEKKTFPIARHFTGLYHSMLTWSYEGGERVRDMYAQHGLSNCVFVANGPTVGMLEGLESGEFSIERKVSAIAKGNYPPIDSIFVGVSGGNQWRRGLLQDMLRRPPQDIKQEIYGYGMPAGMLGSLHDPRGCGFPVAAKYANSLFGVNPQVSSLFNTRLRDLWASGVAQLIHDPHEELAEIGFLPGVHYIPFNGTAEDLYQKIQLWKNTPARLAKLIRAAHDKSVQYMKENQPGAKLVRMYYDGVTA